MLIDYTLGQTSIILRVKIRQDTTGASPGKGLTGLSNTSTGLIIAAIADNESSTIAYTSGGSTIQTISTLGTYVAPSASNCRFAQVDATNHPGVYELQLANARYAVSSSKSLMVTLSGVSGMMDCDVVVPLRAVNPYDGVAGGMSALVLHSGTAQSGSNANAIKLDAAASSTTGIYNGCLVYITAGTGIGQVRCITNYNASSKQATVDRAFTTAPDTTSVFAILPTDNPALNASLAVSTSASTVIIRSGTAQTGSTANTIVLDSGASATNGLYNGDLITITGGTGAGQSRPIISYVGSTKVATVGSKWITTPDNTSTFNIYASNTPTQFSDQGVAQAGGAATITLQSTASATNSIYVGSIVTILSGTGAGETGEITAYNGTSKVATVSSNWATPPDSTSAYAVIPTASGTGAAPQQPIFDANGNVFVVLADAASHGGILGSSTATLALQQENIDNPSGTAFTAVAGAGQPAIVPGTLAIGS